MSVKVVAVSGGVDSVVLLHKLVQSGEQIIVAHVDHGIRDDSSDDARFVEGLAGLYGCRFAVVGLGLGARASEELARQMRYEFLFNVAKQYNGTLLTAHHGDDLVETVAINLKRGTGWRGLCVLSRAGIERPLLELSKQRIYDYAMQHNLEYVEDKTNRDLKYLRNQVRAQLQGHSLARVSPKLYELRLQQIELRAQIDQWTSRLIGTQAGSRHFFTQIPEPVAIELLGSLIYKQTNLRPVGAQLERALVAIKTAKAGSVAHVGSKILLRFTPRVFSVEVL